LLFWLAVSKLLIGEKKLEKNKQNFL